MSNQIPTSRPILGALVVAALVGAVAGASLLALAFMRSPGLMLEMDRDLPRAASGFYSTEQNQDGTFAWTSGRADLRLPGADRRSPWSCVARVRGGRGPQIPQPVVDLAIDGVTLATSTATNTFRDMEVTAPARPSASGLTFTIQSTPTFTPGPSDARELGVQVDRLGCRPATSLALPPRRALAAAAMTAAIFGAALTLIGLTAWGAIGGTLLLAIAQAVPLSIGLAPYSPYVDRVVWIALWIAAPIALGVRMTERWRRQPLHQAARFVLAFSTGALFVQLLALLHPSKQIVDAVFHAHRLEWVLSGRYFFTQPMPDGVQFPYAIGLYVFAAPWSVFTRDYVTLLRIVVCASHALAGALLYPMIARTWGDRLAGALAVVLYHLVPLPYLVIGNANLTFAFGQSAFVVTLAAAALWPLRSRDIGQLVGLFLLTSLALLSHVGIAPLLLATLVALAVLYRLLGGAAWREPARSVLIAAVLATIFSIAAYYGHFTEAYKTLSRVRTQATATESRTDVAAPKTSATPPAPAPLHRRALLSLGRGVSAIGWPIVGLAVVGLWRLWLAGARDRLGLVLAACGVVYLAFVAFRVAAPVEARFQRYADEFIDRVNYAMMPAAAILAARGLGWAWRAGSASRVAAAALLVAAAYGALQQWIEWLR